MRSYSCQATSLSPPSIPRRIGAYGPPQQLWTRASSGSTSTSFPTTAPTTPHLVGLSSRAHPPPTLEGFLASRMAHQQDDRIPALDLSNDSSSSDESLSNSDDEDPPKHHLSSESQRTSRFSPFLSPKYQFPPHIAPFAGLESEDWSNCKPILKQSNLLATALLLLTPCSSCGTDPSLSTTSYIILSCDHLLCPACLNTLVNAVSNDPPREPDCFACGRAATSFRGVKFVEGGKGEDMRTPKKGARILQFGTPETIPGLSPFRKLDWSESFSTPGTTPESRGRKSSSFASPSMNEIPQPQAWHVVRVDNIPWDLTIADVTVWIPSSVSTIPSETQALSVHILCNRHDCRTLNNLYIELPSLAAAQSLVRLKNGKTIQGRPISVVLSSQTELLENIFPAWEAGFDSVDAADPASEGLLITTADLEGLVELCRLETPRAIKAPERAFLQVATILIKFPWHQPEVYSEKLAARIFSTVEAFLSALLTREDKFKSSKDHQSVLNILLDSALACPAFRSSQKNKLLLLAGTIDDLPDSISSFSPTSSTNLRSPTLDRLKYPSPPRFLSHLPSPSQLPTTPTRQSSEIRKSFVPLSKKMEEDEVVSEMASEMGVGEKVVRRIMEEGLKRLGLGERA